MTDLDKSWEALVGPESAAEVTAPAASEELEQEEKQIGERAAHLLKMAREAGFGDASDAIEAKLTEEAQVEAFLAENYKSMLDNLVKAEKMPGFIINAVEDESTSFAVITKANRKFMDSLGADATGQWHESSEIPVPEIYGKTRGFTVANGDWRETTISNGDILREIYFELRHKTDDSDTLSKNMLLVVDNTSLSQDLPE